MTVAWIFRNRSDRSKRSGCARPPTQYCRALLPETSNGDCRAFNWSLSGTWRVWRGRGAAGKVPVFGLLKRGGKVYTQEIPNTKARTLLPVLKAVIKPDSIVYTDSWPSYNVLDVSDFKHFRIDHARGFANRQNHINGIENFWNQAKRVLRKYNGIPRKHFQLFLKECEFRFNYGSPKQQLQTLRIWCNL